MFVICAGDNFGRSFAVIVSIKLSSNVNSFQSGFVEINAAFCSGFKLDS
jgi:hypothetical protein